MFVTNVRFTTRPAVLGAVIIEIRRQLGLTQKDLAERMMLSQSAWSRIEKGLALVNIVQLDNVSEELGYTTHDLFLLRDKALDKFQEAGIEIFKSIDDALRTFLEEDQDFSKEEIKACELLCLSGNSLRPYMMHTELISIP